MTEHAEQLARQLDEESFQPIPMTPAQLAFTWRRLVDDSHYLANLLHRYQQDEGWSDATLAEFLGTDLNGLYQTGVAGMPRPASVMADIKAIAGASGINAMRLAQIHQAVQSRDTFRGADRTRRVLAAARDHDDAPPADDAGPGEDRHGDPPHNDPNESGARR